METKIFAYIRVSTKEQNIDRQLEAIKDYCKKEKILISERDIYIDRQSGKDFFRENYQVLKYNLRKGDTLVIKELDRLGRNKDEVKKELEFFKEKKILVRILNIPTTLLDFSKFSEQTWIFDMINNILIEVLGAIAQEEREKIRQRQREGIDAAKAQGKHLGKALCYIS